MGSWMGWNSGGTRVATAGQDGTVWLYYVRSEDLLATACARAVRGMSEEEWGRYAGDVPYRQTCPGKPVPGRDYEMVEERVW